MNKDNWLSDMKQLLRTELSQTEELLRTELSLLLKTEIYQTESHLMKEITDIHTEITEGFAGIGDPLTTVNDQLEDHETRIGLLEHKAA